MRLIDADKIYRHIKAEINPYGKSFEGTAYEFGLKLLGYIDNMQQTAYDIDKVVKELEEHFNATDNKEVRLAYHHAIEIVKAGGQE